MFFCHSGGRSILKLDTYLKICGVQAINVSKLAWLSFYALVYSSPSKDSLIFFFLNDASVLIFNTIKLEMLITGN